jgi:predicted GIY-YIG superfamily endonuclease
MEGLWLYVLRLDGDNYYVGTTPNLTKRFTDHWAGKGSAWTKKHPPLEAVSVVWGKTLFDEEATAKKYMADYGVHRVRGGSYTQLTLSENQLEALERELRHARGSCFLCGSDDHWASACTKSVNKKTLTEPKRNCSKCGASGHRANACAIETPRPTKRPTKRVYCERCGRDSHVVVDCYAARHIDGTLLLKAKENLQPQVQPQTNPNGCATQ